MGRLEPHAVFMSAEIGYGFFIVEVIGDFPEEEARRFTEYTLARAGKSSHLTSDDWHRVHEVRRGSRRRVATAISVFISRATNCDQVSKHCTEHQPTVMLKLCHLYCRYAGEMLVSSA